MRTQVLDTSIDAYHGIGNAYKATVCDSIYSIVAESKSALSLREIQSRYNDLFEANIDVSTVSGRVNELIAAISLRALSTGAQMQFQRQDCSSCFCCTCSVGLV